MLVAKTNSTPSLFSLYLAFARLFNHEVTFQLPKTNREYINKGSHPKIIDLTKTKQCNASIFGHLCDSVLDSLSECFEEIRPDDLREYLRQLLLNTDGKCSAIGLTDGKSFVGGMIYHTGKITWRDREFDLVGIDYIWVSSEHRSKSLGELSLNHLKTSENEDIDNWYYVPKSSMAIAIKSTTC